MDCCFRWKMDRTGHRKSAASPSGSGRQGYIAGGAVTNEKGVGTVDRRASSERWARREAVQGSGGSRTAVRCGRRKSMGLGTGFSPASQSMRVPLARSKTNGSSMPVPPTFCCRSLPRLSGVCRKMIHSMHCGGVAKVAAPGDVVCRRWR